MNNYILPLSILLCISITGQTTTPDEIIEIEKNGMKVSLEAAGESLSITMVAPTQGWVAIGFNETSGLTGTYLLMGAVKSGSATVVEHLTLSPGNYQSLVELGQTVSVSGIEGGEEDGMTKISFRIPIKPSAEAGKDLSKGKSYSLLIAYSREDDFQHHSMMRTTVQVTL